MLNLLEKAIDLSKEILELCKEDDWDSVNTLQTQRQQLIALIANTPLPENNETLNKCSILAASLKSISKEIEILSRVHKEVILTEIKASNKAKRMTTAYQQ